MFNRNTNTIQNIGFEYITMHYNVYTYNTIADTKQYIRFEYITIGEASGGV